MIFSEETNCQEFPQIQSLSEKSIERSERANELARCCDWKHGGHVESHDIWRASIGMPPGDHEKSRHESGYLSPSLKSGLLPRDNLGDKVLPCTGLAYGPEPERSASYADRFPQSVSIFMRSSTASQFIRVINLLRQKAGQAS